MLEDEIATDDVGPVIVEDVLVYIESMLRELHAMADAGDFDVLGYLIEMARSEAESQVRAAGLIPPAANER